MRRLLLTMLAVLAVAPALALAATKPVDITRAGFSPNKLTIDPGDTVTWTNKDTTPHQVVADQGKFPASLVLQSGQSYSYTFTRSGSYGYRDAFATNKRGTVTVRVGVSMTASKMTMTYGATTTLSGSVSDGSSGETVTIDAQECGKTGFTKIATVKSGANGAWSYAAKPALNTVYEAHWKTAKSAQVTVKVRPGLTLGKLGSRRFAATVSAAQSFVGKYVVLQRFVRSRRAWVAVKRVTLSTVKAGTPPTMVTSARFRARLRRGTLLRLFLPQSQAGACYATTRSGTRKA